MEGQARRSLRAEHVEATRRALLDAARRRFGADGFAATSVEDIVADAGVTKGALYHHFTNKEHLFEIVFDEVEAELAERSSASGLRGGGDAIAVLHRGFAAFLDAALETDVRRIALVDAPSVLGAERFDEIVRSRSLGVITLGLRAAIDEGTLRPLDPEPLAHLLLGACSQAGMLIARSPDPKRARRSVGRTLRALVDGLSA